MKNLFTLFVGLIISTFTIAQDYQDLLILKADGDWEKLIKEAEKYTLKSKTENDALPYYYLAYGQYKISFVGDRDEAYKNAYKDALSTVGKLGRKDETGEVREKYADFFNELKLSLLEIIQNDFEAGEHRRAFGWVMRIYKFDRDNISGKLLEAVCRYRNSDKATARSKWREAEELIKAADASTWSEADKQMIMFGLYESAKCLVEGRQEDQAKEIMNWGAEHFEEYEKWNQYYDEIVN
ncbi:MAG: hypothetical protein R3277_05630 [Brumimicrobium sp.]|nr:hypothetical protein [Brumimicrobium sp.]